MKRIMGVDYGKARIGIALSDELQMLAHPVETIAVAKTPNPIARIADITQEKNVERIIVGLPRHMNGSEGASAEEARAFAEKLQAAVSCEVGTWTNVSRPWRRIARCRRPERKLAKPAATSIRWPRR